MKGHGPAYNVQTVVDAEHALIVTHEVTTEATDNTSLQPMAEAARDALEQPTLNVVADAGYSNGAQAEALEAQGIVAHIPANQLALNKLLINQAFENMGLRTTQMLGTFFDGITRHTEEAYRWVESFGEKGFREVIRERDAPWQDYGERPTRGRRGGGGRRGSKGGGSS